MSQKTRTKKDKHTTPGEKNAALSLLLGTLWNALEIEKIERVTVGEGEGWRAFYNE